MGIAVRDQNGGGSCHHIPLKRIVSIIYLSEATLSFDRQTMVFFCSQSHERSFRSFLSNSHAMLQGASNRLISHCYVYVILPLHEFFDQ
jgi:hypothetical protein